MCGVEDNAMEAEVGVDGSQMGGGQFGKGDGVWKGQHGSREQKRKSRSTFRNSAQHFFVSSSFQPTSSPPSHYDNYLLLHKHCAISIP